MVPTFRRAALLERCLQALIRQTCASYEVIVVDDASDDDTSRVLSDAQHWPWRGRMRALRNAENAGPAASRNRGIQATIAPYVAFTDDDCEPDVHWLDELLQALTNADERVAGVGGRVLFAEPAGLIAEFMTLHRILEPPPSLNYLVTAN